MYEGLRQKLPGCSSEQNADWQKEIREIIHQPVFLNGAEWLSSLTHLLEQWQAPARSWLILLGGVICQDDAVELERFGELTHSHLTEEIRRYRAMIKPLDEEPDVEEHRPELRADRLRELYRLAYVDTDLALLCAAALSSRIEFCVLQKDPNNKCTIDFADDGRVILLPFLEMLGLWEICRKVGNLVMKIARADEWALIENGLKQKRKFYNDVHGEIIAVLQAKFGGHNLRGELSPHISPPASIQRRVDRSAVLRELLNLVKVDVLVDSPQDCYRALGIIHEVYKPIGGRSSIAAHFRDQIATPKFNGYRALITTVAVNIAGREGESRVEFRIRTRDMERTNTMGVAACLYGGVGRGLPAWWNNIAQREFVRSLRSGVITPQIFVFSHLGEMLEMSYGSTPLDFAYAIHSEIAEHIIRIDVNGRASAFDAKLRNGDLVYLETRQGYNAVNEQWLTFLHTPRAVYHVKRRLGQLRPPELKTKRLVKKLIDREFAASNLPVLTADALDRAFDEQARYLGHQTSDEMFAAIDTKQLGHSVHRMPKPELIVSRITGAQLCRYLAREDNTPLGLDPRDIRFVRIVSTKKRTPLCISLGEPVVGRYVVAKSGRKRLSVYGKNRAPEIKPDEFVALKWRDASEISRKIVIESPDYSMLLEDILRPVYESYTAGVYLTNVVARTSEQMAHIELEVNSPSLLPIQNLEASYRLMREGRKIAYVAFQDQSPFQRQINARATLNNPYSAGPVKEARMFKGREKELGQLQEVIGSEQRIAVLYGQLRVGKTSLAHHAVQQVLPEKNHFASYVDLQKLAEKTDDELWRELASAINKTAVEQRRVRTRRALFERTLRARKGEAFRIFNQELKEIWPIFGGNHPVLFVDELGALENGATWPRSEADRLIANMIQLIEEHPDMRWVLCAHESLLKDQNIQSASRPILKMAFQIAMKYLDQTAALRLIRQPLVSQLTYDPDAEKEILRLTGCHPYFLHSLLFGIVAEVNAGSGRLVKTADVNIAMERLLDSGGYQFSHLVSNLSERERTVLSSIAGLTANSETITITELLRDWQRKGLQTSVYELKDIVDTLCGYGVIDSLSADAKMSSRYFISVPLLAKWQRRRGHV